MSATVVFGGQVGSEGKGAICGYLAKRTNYTASICSFMTNAGHTWIGDDGEKVMVQQIPIALINPNIELLIGPGAGINLETILGEIERYDPKYDIKSRLMIHPRAVMIEERHAEMGKEHSRARAGVGKGCSRANAEKSMRLPTAKLARDVPELQMYTGDTTGYVNILLDSGASVLVEGAQGFDLDVNHGISYPFCTSRGTTPMQVLADCGIAPTKVSRSIAVVRTYPIRVGNIVEDGEQVGYSGGFEGNELSWEEVTKRSGYPFSLEERTTVTKRVRRVFEISMEQLYRMIVVCDPSEIALTFADYLDYCALGVAGDLGRALRYNFPKIRDFVEDLVCALNTEVTMIKTGPQDGSMLHL